MHYFKLYLALYFCLLFCQCSNKVIGEYSSKGDMSNTQLWLKKDGTFHLLLNGEMVNTDTKGTWVRNKDLLFLKSFDSYHHYKVDEKDSIDFNKVLILLNEKNQFGIQGSYIVLNNDTSKKYIFDETGKIFIPHDKSDFNSFEIYSVNRPDKYYRKDNHSNFFNITFDIGTDNVTYMEEYYLIKNGKLCSQKYNDLCFQKK